MYFQNYVQLHGFLSFDLKDSIFIAIILPSFYHSFSSVITFFIWIHILFWFSIGLIFSLAHIYKNSKFPVGADMWEMMKVHFFHQIETTQDFSPQNPVLNWYMGGLNNQVAHHLFPHISHIHYPSIQKVIQKPVKNSIFLITVRRVFYKHFFPIFNISGEWVKDQHNSVK